MAASDSRYSRLAAKLGPLLDKWGATFTVTAPGTYDPATMSTGAPTARTVRGLVADQTVAKGLVGADAHEFISVKTLILEGTANPEPGEKITVDGREFAFSKAKALKPANVVVMYTLDIS